MTKKKKGLISKVFGFETIKQGAIMTKSMMQDVNPSKKELIRESFHKALIRNGITKSEENSKLLSLYKNQKIQFIIIFSGALFMGYNAVISIMTENESLSDLLSGISYTTLTFALFSISLHYAFRCFQIRKKRLGMLKSWLSTPSEWFPTKITQEKLERLDSFQKENPKHLAMIDNDYLEELKKEA